MANRRDTPPAEREDLTTPIRAGNANNKAGKKEKYAFLLPALEKDELGRLGQYRVLKLLGMGGMGMVFLAEDISLRRPVALKVLKPEFARNRDQDGQRFVREAQSMAKIKHNRLVTIYQCTKEGETIYLVMELLEGQNLDDWIRTTDNPDMIEIIRMSRDIAMGLEAIHQQGLVHRDIKPGNLWREASGRVKILDFGLAREVYQDTQITEPGVVVGTPAFLSPEQARGKPADHRSDLFSLGCVMYRLCTKKLPFEANNTLDQLAAIAADQPVGPRELNPDVPEPLADLILQLLEKNPERRLQSAAEVAEQLQQIKRQLTSRGKRNSATRKSGIMNTATLLGKIKLKSGRRNWLPIVAGGIILLVFAVVLAVAVPMMLAKKDGPPKDGPPKPFANGDKKDLGGANVVYLANMKKESTVNWPFAPPKKDDFPPKGDKKGQPKGPPPGGDTPVWANGKFSPNGIFMHGSPEDKGPPASISYRLGKQFKSFSTQVSVNDGAPPDTRFTATFEVWGDGVKLWSSNPVQSQADIQDCSISVQGVDLLRLEVRLQGSPMGCHIVWIEPRVEK